MKLVLVRHAKALDRIKAVLKMVPDSKRPLTKKGQLKFAAHVLKNKKFFKADSLFVESEYLRSQQTLDLIIEKLNYKKVARLKLKKITPDDSPEYFLKWVKTRKEESVVMVGHEPFLSQFLSGVLGVNWPGFKIKKGTIVELEYKTEIFNLKNVSDPQPLKK